MANKYFVIDDIRYDGGAVYGPYATLEEAKAHISNDSVCIIHGTKVWSCD